MQHNTITFLFMLMLVPFLAKAQLTPPDTAGACRPSAVFTIVAEMPTYEGGMRQLALDLMKELSLQKKEKAQGAIRVAINCKSEAYAFRALYGTNESLSAEIVKSLEGLQNWHAGKHRDRTVDAYLTFRWKASKGQFTIIE